LDAENVKTIGAEGKRKKERAIKMDFMGKLI
jgi:hypothetical protein